MSAQETELQIGRVLGGRYRIVADGVAQDIGTRYKAYDSQADRLVSVLVLARRFAGSSEVLDHLARGQEAVADLAVPALVPVEDIGVVDGQPYLVRSPVDGHPLGSLLARTGPLGVEAAVQITVHLCEALAPAHRVGLVHGGLSPDSVLVGENGQVAVTDAGLWPTLQEASGAPGRPWGRFPYLSPEQAAGEIVHPAADVYVIGSLLYEMLTGRPPFQAQDPAILVVRHLRQDPPSLQVLAPNVPPPLAQIVHKALAKEPAARYRNAGQLAHILRSQVGSGRAEPAIVQPAPHRERLVVPAPSVAEHYPPDVDFEDLAEEPVGVDWLMVALVIAALIAVLGLIPLWRAVYRRYSAPPLSLTPASFYTLSEETVGSLPDAGNGAVPAIGNKELDDFGLVWYNLVIGNYPLSRAVPEYRLREGTTVVATNHTVWESRLRV
jgi:serine/threonine protein kinase